MDEQLEQKLVEQPEQKKAKSVKRKSVPVAPNALQQSMLADLSKLGLPVLATGGSLITWKNDLTGIGLIQITRTPDKEDSWITVHGDGAKKVPESQYKVFCFVAVALITSSRTDRGAAYGAWVNTHAKVLQKYFSEYTWRVTFNKSSIPLLQFTLGDVIKIVSITSAIVKTSLLLKAPTRRTTTRKDKEEKFDIIII